MTMILPGLLLFLGLAPGAVARQDDVRGGVEKFGVCEREAKSLVGERAVIVGKKVTPPKKTRNALPAYPAFSTKLTGSGVWVGEVLIDQAGRIARVWPIREPEFDPPTPVFSEAVVDAIHEWEYEPLRVRGRARPVCLTVSMNIHGR